MAKFLVTGGAGFIGGNFLHIMVKRYEDDEYVCLDSLTYAGNRETIQPVLEKRNFRFIKEDICNRKAIDELFEKEKFDYVIHFAAESHVDRSIGNPELFLRTNILGTQVLMDASRKYGVKRFHQVSTDEVYGDLPLNQGNLFFTEESPLRPSNPYSASKASADFLALSYRRTFHLPLTISRSTNNYGPYQYPEKLIPLLIEKAMKNEPLPLYGTGENIRDWLFVEDCCNAIDLIVHHGRDGEIYNISAGNERTNLQVAREILKILGKQDSLIYFSQDRPGHDRRYALDSTKIRKELGWKPVDDFVNGLHKTIQWYLRNLQWIRDVKRHAEEKKSLNF